MILRVLITGAAGFIGRHVAAEYVKRGLYVIGMDRSEWVDWRTKGIAEWHCCEVSIDTLVKYACAPDVIVHCAGGASVGFSLQNPYQDFIQTVPALAQVLEYMRLYAPRAKLFYPSSAAVYGQVKKLPISEDFLLCPISPYGLYKQIAEGLCQLYATQYHLSVIVVRLFSIYGEGLRKQLLWDACGKLQQGRAEFFGTGEEVRDWLHVDDVTRLIVLSVEHASPKCPILNGGSGEGVSVRNILEVLSAELGSQVQPHFSANQKLGDPSSYVANTYIANSWGWRPGVNWRTGIQRYASWFKSEVT